MMINKLQQIQDNEYSFPYHYISQFADGFTQCFNDTWGINYVSTIEFILKKLEEINFDSIIDVGCGDGRLTLEMQKKFYGKLVCGTDYSARAINLARAMNPNGNYLQSDITKPHSLPKYDVAVLMEVLEHIPVVEADGFVNSIAGLLNKNGKLLITVPHSNKPLEYKHFRHFSSHTLQDSIKNSFEIEEIIFFERNDWRKEMIDSVLTNRFFILNSGFIKKIIYRYYKSNLFIVPEEKKCKRIFMKLNCK